ncbi:synaptic vesicle glycoprotein 2A [Plutella xylostella]|uniref:synaptic vesicle glycoprotein 2A n=1 Tax=Plutella xylostella TaxID=51655 RepID=UPI00203299CC|nr:synaptic vesicle glycoprotein 2A [Plutella xylostella]
MVAKKVNCDKVVVSENRSKILFDSDVIRCEDKLLYSYEEALTVAGHGRYSYLLLLLLSLTLMAMGLDMFGFSVVVTGCSCEFELTQTQKGILGSMPYAGPIVMSYTWGYISDTRGRRRSLLVAMLGASAVSALSALSPNWVVLAVMKLVGTSFVSCAQSATFSLLGESCCQRVRGPYLFIMSTVMHTCPIIYFSLGYLILGLDFSYDVGFMLFSPWRLYILILSLAPLIGFFCMLPLVESPKFLANQDREEEALKALERIWVINGGEPNMYPVRRIILDEAPRVEVTSLARSLWEQTAPLFKPPYLKYTLQLYYITIVLYGTCNSLMTWLPFVANDYFASTKSSDNIGLCDVLGDNDVDANYSSNSTDIFTPECSSKLKQETLFVGVALGTTFTTINILMSLASSRKKCLSLMFSLLGFTGTIGVIFGTNPVLVLPFYVLCLTTSIQIGILSSYYVILFPSLNRGMAGCLGVMVARLSALAGINLAGAAMFSACHATFGFFAVFILSGALMACFLPSDNISKLL